MGRYANPYRELTATAELSEPDGRTTRRVPLFWDGGSRWTFRFSPDKVGGWVWRVISRDPGLDGRTGRFRVVPSDRPGSIRPMNGHPYHFERRDGSAFWFMGDTAWALYTDSTDERHNRATVEGYIDTRAEQGFNVVHSMLLSEAGWGHLGGPPFHAIEREEINPAYWQEVDRRIAYVNRRGLIAGLARAWGDKRRVEPYAWRRFPPIEARKRYARFVAARFGAFDVYFIISGEWHGEVRTREDVTEAGVKREFVEIGNALAEAAPHERMVAIHPMTRHGSQGQRA